MDATSVRDSLKQLHRFLQPQSFLLHIIPGKDVKYSEIDAMFAKIFETLHIFISYR